MRLNFYAKIGAISGMAVLLSGCSWLGFGSKNSHQGYNYGKYESSNKYGQYQGRQIRGGLNPCQITAPTQPVPQGCRPEQVTLALGGQNAAYGAGGYNGHNSHGQYASSGYGSHVGNAANVREGMKAPLRYKRPFLRGQLSVGIDHSISGELYQPSTATALTYNRAAFVESETTGSVAAGQVVQTIYSSTPERIDAANISFDDVYTAPLAIRGGAEMILSDHATLFANLGYIRAEGKKGGGASVVDTLTKTVITSDYNTDAANGPIGQLIGSTTSASFMPNEVVATYDYKFNDLEKYDIELGGRYYFDPVFKSKFQRPLTPFISASGGVAHYNDTTVQENQSQRFLKRAFEDDKQEYYDVNFGTRTKIYDAGWVPYAGVKAGLEWQVSPRSALAFEAGLKYEKARDFSNGTKGDDIVSVPVTIRGSFNF